MPRPGLIALFLIAAMAFSLGLQVDRESSILEEAYSQVVVVVCGSTGYGTGWFVNSEYVVTAYHVVAGCGNITLVRDPWLSPASIAAYDAEHDIAVLKTANPPEWAKGLPLSYKVSIGDPIYVVGYPVQLYAEAGNNVRLMSRNPRVASGTVSWLHPERPIFQFDIPTDAGNSGGPVVSKESGGVVGLVVYARPGIVSEGYFGLRMDYVAQFLDSHGIPYRVAGGGAPAWLLGLGLGLALALAFLAFWGGRHG